jgi:hypothetical protein
MIYGRVYSIRSHQTSDIYIGSTTQTLSQRLTDHRRDYKYFLNHNNHYMTSYEILKYGDEYIEVIYEGDFESKQSLKRKEGEYQREMKCVNKVIAGRTSQELFKIYYEKTKEHRTNYNHQYYDEHKEQILEHVTQYRNEHKDQISHRRKQKITCACGSVICIGAKQQHERSKKHLEYFNII